MAILAPGSVVFALPAIDLIARNQEFFAGDFTAGRVLYMLALITTAIGSALWALSTTRTGRFLFTCYLLITPGWILYSMLLGWRRAVGVLIVAVLVLVVASLMRPSGSSQFVGIGLFSFVILAGTIAMTSIESRPVDADEGSRGIHMSEDARSMSTSLPNVYHIVFDEFQTEMFETAFDARVQEALAGFTYYPDARTQYGRTEMSMASIFGATNYNYDVTPQDFVNSSLRGVESSLQQLRRAGYHITGYTLVESIYGSPQPFDRTVLFEDFVESNPGSNYAQLAMSLWAYSKLPGSMARQLIPSDSFDQLTGQNLLPAHAPAVSLEAFRTFINRERQLSATGRYSLVHLILPHFPYVLSADCQYEVGLDTTPTAQAACATSLMVTFIEELRSLDRFDEAAVVIQSDHGARFELSEEGELHQVSNDFFGEQWSDARSRSLLLIKPAGIDSSEGLVVSDYPAELTDIMPTVFDSLGMSFAVSEGRNSLLNETLPVRRLRHYHFYNKGADGLPDGELARFEIVDGLLTADQTIELPDS